MSLPESADILVVGLNVVDVLVRLPGKIRRGEKHQVQDLMIQGGGPASNAACLLASLGWRTGLVVRMGSDTLSSVARAEFARHGVLDDYFIPDDLAMPAMAVVAIEPATGERTVFYTLNGYQSLRSADVPVDEVKHAKLILMDGYEMVAARKMLEAAHGTGCRSVLDVEAGEAAGLLELIRLATDIILPLGTAQRLTGKLDVNQALEELSIGTQGQLLVTNGIAGSWGLTQQGILHQPAFQVETLDTTGCGDAYHAAYASAMLDGLPVSLRMEFAAWVAAQVARNLGGRSNLPTRASIRRADLSMLSPELRKHLQPLNVK